jgi:hypothetical protein
MLKKKTIINFIKFFIIIITLNFFSNCYAETIIFKDCDNGIDGFKKNEYIINLEKSLMTRVFTYDSKTYKKYRLTDIKTKKKNSITRFIYKEGNQILTDKLGYPKFYTQLVFEKNNLNVMIKSVINNESAIAKLSKCKKIETFQSES